MSDINFSTWLVSEVKSSMMALVTIRGKLDYLLNVEKPEIEKEYMEKIGNDERKVIEFEKKAEYLKKKIQKIQSYINRRKPIDLKEIDEELSVEFDDDSEEKMDELSQTGSFQSLPLEKNEEMKEMYQKITKFFHPEINKTMTQMEKEAYSNAVSAFRKGDYETMKLAYDILFYAESDYNGYMIEADYGSTESTISKIAETLTADYALATSLFDCFEPLEEDMVLKSTNDSYISEYRKISDEMKKAKEAFPFNAIEVLRNSDKLAEYRKELDVRLERSISDITDFENEIEDMLKEHGNV